MIQLLLRNWLLGVVVLVVVGVFIILPALQSNETVLEPELITLSTGSTRTVSDGRAQLWLGEIDAAYDGSRLVEVVEFELSCRGKIYYGQAVTERPTQDMCGCRVRLVEVLDTSPPSARLEVTLTMQFTPALQAASQAQRPPAMSGTSRSRPAGIHP